MLKFLKVREDMKIVLASKSPRRKEILQNLNIDFEICVSDSEEKSSKTDVREYVKELSLQKAENVKLRLKQEKRLADDTLIIGCDTVVSIDGAILGKPKDKADAFSMIKKLSGKGHSVISGITLIYNDKVLCESEETKVFFDDIEDSEIEEYISTTEPYDKAGGYAFRA